MYCSHGYCKHTCVTVRLPSGRQGAREVHAGVPEVTVVGRDVDRVAGPAGKYKDISCYTYKI